MKVPLTLAIITVLFIIPVVQADDCLTLDEQDALIAVATANNQSPSLFISIFEEFCDYSYTKGEIEDMIEDEVENQTEWIEDQVDITGYLETMASNMDRLINASATLDDIDRRLDDQEEEILEEVAMRTEDLDQEMISENDVLNLIRNNQPKQTQEAVPWWGWPLFGVVALGLLLFWYTSQQKGRLPSLGGSSILPRRTGHAHQYATPGRTRLPFEEKQMQELKDQVMGGNDDKKPPVAPAKAHRRGKGNDNEGV